MLKTIFTLLTVISASIIFSQNSTTSTISSGAINVYIDGCWYCDFDNFKRNIKYVNFMNTRQEADVFILVTNQNIGNGGKMFTLYFEGQNAHYLNKRDTLHLTTNVDDTDRIINDELLSKFKMGIISYVMKSEIANKIQFIFHQEEDKSNGSMNIDHEIDKWNSWHFSVSARGNLDGEKSSNGIYLNGRFSANRITEANKISISTRYNYQKSNFHLITYDSLGNEDENEHFSSLRRSQYGFAEYVKSLSDHWSAGATLNVNSNTFNNLDLSSSLKFGLEYNYYAYGESDRRSLTIKYTIGPLYNNYVDTTIFDQTSELIGQHILSLDLAQKQKWGSLYFGVDYRNYLHDFSLYNLSFNPNIDWNIMKGLTLGVGGYLSFIGDQISIPQGNLDIPDLILKNRIVATSFSYWGYFNIRYSFGTKYNNVVNPRYGG